MRNKRFFIACFALCLLCPNFVRAQYHILGKKYADTPDWMKGVSTLPRSNDSYEFILVDNAGPSLQSLEAGKLTALGQKLTQINKINGVIDKTVESSHKDGNLTAEVKHKMVFQTETEVYEFVSKFIDDYWEYILYPDGSRGYIYYALFAVSKGGMPHFDDISFSTQYGSHGLWRSMIVPGWGQFYKGSKTKGAVFLGGTAALAGTTVYFQSRIINSRNLAAQTYNPEHLRIYSRRISNFSTARNVCIGATAALYVWNLVDAVVAPGARRIVVKPAVMNTSNYYGGNPYSTTSFGVGAEFNF